MRSVHRWLELYDESHRHPTNKAIHWVAVPVIAVTLIALLGQVEPMPGVHWFNGGTAFLVGALFYHVALSWRLAVGMLLVSAACLVLVHALSWLPLPVWQAAVLAFVVAWAFQFYGHQIEGRRPSFLQDVQFLLIGPLWLLASVYRRWGIRY